MKLVRLLIVATGAVGWLLLPQLAFADNCGSLNDCYFTLRAAVAATVGLGLFAVLLSFGLDLIPGVGTVKGVIEAITGRDLITGQELAWWERLLGIVPLGGAIIGAGVAATRVASHVDDIADIARAGDRVGDVVHTGARFGDKMDTFERWERYAPEAYERIRNTDDIADIARNTGWSESRVERIKDHVFVREHQLDDAVRRFDADPDMADAWGRMQRGEHTAEDVRLLDHEYFESRFEGIFRTDYRTAHDAAIRSGRTWTPPE